MSDPFVAEIRIFPFNFAPRGWAWCDGQLMPLSQNTALFSLLGTTYGGNGKSNFALPDLRGRVPMGTGEGPGLTWRELGEAAGDEAIGLEPSEMPQHSHALQAVTSGAADTKVPGSTTSLAPSSGGALYQKTADSALAQTALTTAGAGSPHNNMQPYLTFAFAIAMQGVFPPRG